MRLTNYHTHTARCKHAQHTDEEYVQAAIRAGYEVFGFADHCPWPYEHGFVSGIRMDVDQLDEYLESIARLKEK
ncbi:MAG: PHP domain-containing protein, partial [Clostridia bacterium]|nr:PHP domain-containing protein [Clostridia bacterium]